MLNGLERGKKDFGIEYGVITCAMRHHSEEENARMIRTARAYLGYGVCAADLAGAESLYPMSEFMELFKKDEKHLACHLPYMQANVGAYRISSIQ